MVEETEYIAVIECLSCHESVEVKVKKDPFDGWHTIICPRSECGKLAYNSKTAPLPKK